jgi:hypothetical protein
MDRTTKFLLAAIALGIWMSILIPVFRPVPVKAASDMDCRGEIKVNAWGPTATSIGGYNVSLKCTQ